MRIEVITPFCGMEVGTQKVIPSGIARNLIDRSLVKEVGAKEDKLNADEAIEMINSFTTINEVNSFMVNETRKGVTAVAEAKIKSLTIAD